MSESYLTREKKERAFDDPKSNGKSGAFIFRGKNLAHQQCTNGVKPKKVGYFLMGKKKEPTDRSRSAWLVCYPALNFTPPTYPQKANFTAKDGVFSQ
jgi:hypothetical protein